MKNIKKLIISLLLIIIVIIILLLLLNNNKLKIINNINGDAGEIVSINDTDIVDIKEIDDYSTLKNILSQYISYNTNDEKDTLFNILDLQFINENSITIDNIEEKIDKINGAPIIIINKIKQRDISENVTSFFVNYDLVNDTNYIGLDNLRFESYFDPSNNNTTQQDNCNIIIILDYYNNTFSVMPNYNEKNNINKINSIQKNINNTFENDTLTTQQEVKLHFQDFINRVIYKEDDVYIKLNEEYKSKRFKNESDFISYIENNKNYFLNCSLEKYKVNVYNDYIEYICIDQYGNYYIFDEKSIMDYTVKLDTYTIDEEEFIEKYNNGSEQLKVGMNLEKIFQALNRKDYEYIYNKLDSNFKANNFATLESFEQYATNTFFELNKVEYGDLDKQANIYIYEVAVSDYTEENENVIEKNFIMSLGEGTEFSISFNI